jgi:hypothetical protein
VRSGNSANLRAFIPIMLTVALIPFINGKLAKVIATIPTVPTPNTKKHAPTAKFHSEPRRNP